MDASGNPVISIAARRTVDLRFVELTDKVHRNRPGDDLDLLRRAYDFAAEQLGQSLAGCLDQKIRAGDLAQLPGELIERRRAPFKLLRDAQALPNLGRQRAEE